MIFNLEEPIDITGPPPGPPLEFRREIPLFGSFETKDSKRINREYKIYMNGYDMVDDQCQS